VEMTGCYLRYTAVEGGDVCALTTPPAHNTPVLQKGDSVTGPGGDLLHTTREMGDLALPFFVHTPAPHCGSVFEQGSCVMSPGGDVHHCPQPVGGGALPMPVVPPADDIASLKECNGEKTPRTHLDSATTQLPDTIGDQALPVIVAAPAVNPPVLETAGRM